MRQPTTRRRRIDGVEYAITIGPARSPGLMRFKVERMAELTAPAEALGYGMIRSASLKISGSARWVDAVLKKTSLEAVREAIRDVAREVRGEPDQRPSYIRKINTPETK